MELSLCCLDCTFENLYPRDADVDIGFYVNIYMSILRPLSSHHNALFTSFLNSPCLPCPLHSLAIELSAAISMINFFFFSSIIKNEKNK